MPDLNELSIEQRMALRSAATHLRQEFDGVFGQETIESFLASSYDQFAAGAKARNFLGLLAERFARQRLKALAKVEGKADDGLPVVLFLCVHNAGRSQMALGWFNALAGDRATAWSGGSEPGAEVNPAAVQAMAEVGIDISREFPKPWTDEIVRAADVVVTMGCGDACPIFPGKRYEDWELADPAGQSLDAVRPIRDEVGRTCAGVVGALGGTGRPVAGAGVGSPGSASARALLGESAPLVLRCVLPSGAPFRELATKVAISGAERPHGHACRGW